MKHEESRYERLERLFYDWIAPLLIIAGVVGFVILCSR